MGRIAIAVCLLLFSVTSARAAFTYEWRGTVTSAVSYGEDPFGNVGPAPSPTGGDILVWLTLDDTYVPGELFSRTQLIDVAIILPADFFSPWPFFGPDVLGFMPKTQGSGSLGIDSGSGILNVDDSGFTTSWEGTCLSDVLIDLTNCRGVEVQGSGGPWTLTSTVAVPEPSNTLLIGLTLVSLGYFVRRHVPKRNAGRRSVPAQTTTGFVHCGQRAVCNVASEISAPEDQQALAHATL